MKVDAGNFPGLVLIKHCVQGAASARQDGQDVEWRQGQTVILSAGRDTELQFDQACLQKSVRFEVGRLEAACARWLGHPLEQPLQFALRPFSDALERIWQQTLGYAWSAEMGGLALSGPAKTAFDDYLLSLLLHQHPNLLLSGNYFQVKNIGMKMKTGRRQQFRQYSVLPNKS